MRELLASVEQVRRSLVWMAQGRAMLLALGAGLSGAIVTRLVAATGSPFAAIVVGVLLGGLTWMLMRPRRTPSGPTAALWIEERQPTAPTFALVTLVEQAEQAGGIDLEGTALHRVSEQIVQRVSIGEALQRMRWQQWRGPVGFVGASMLLLLMSVWLPRGEGRSDRAGRGGLFGGTSPDSGTTAPLGAWTVQVTPPAYAGGGTRTFGDVASVSALTGSVVELRGDGPVPEALSARVDSLTGQSLPARAADGGWSVRANAESAPTTVRLTRGGRTRLLVIEGHADTIPSVMLQAPARDSVFREARGVLPLTAAARDDIGLARAWFELIVSSGEGERFTVRTLTVGERTWPQGAHQRQASFTATLDIGALKLVPGDVVHLRAVARDGHPSPSRDLGSSETRSFRIARPAEYDSVAVEPAPPPDVDKSLLSQRMLLLLTEKLDRQQRGMARADVVRESQRLARDQSRLRQAVGDVIFQRLSGESSGEHAHSPGDGHDHGVDLQDGKLALNNSSTSGMLEEGNDSPIVAINQPLLEAYNAMWDAGRALEQGDPHGAIPPMRLALEAIERSRAASRIYLRGRPPQVILDIDKIRLVGKDTGLVANRSSRDALPRRGMERDARLVRIAQLLAQYGAAPEQRTAARDSVALLRAEALSDAPVFATALGRVLDGLEKGGDVTPLLVDARRALGNVERAPVGRWSRTLPP